MGTPSTPAARPQVTKPSPRPAHHGPDGRYRSPWPEASLDDSIRGRIGEVAREWLAGDHPPDPSPDQLPIEPWETDRTPVDQDQARVTWVGHASFLLELPGANLLTDPVWSPRVSPVPWIGSRRFVPASPGVDALPEIHGVILSHDHFDHLDSPTVRRLHRRFGHALEWFTPPGYRSWFQRRGIRNVTELDWWQSAPGPAGHAITAAPARHWTRRTPWGTNTRLWNSWVIGTPTGAGGTGVRAPRIYFGGDTAYASHFTEVADRLGPFDASLLPIGAYEPRWFMKVSHMNPEEAVQAYVDLGSAGDFIPTHWGTFRLTFEDPLEPPERTRAAWTEAGLDPDRLRIPRHGETLLIRS
jgi:N-acyl-phosphatidylethanolamine-hydrolysing phospholipase D